MRTLALDDPMPKTARVLWQTALAHGWRVWATVATGTPLDADGQPQRVRVRVPLVDTQTGLPVMTEGSPATATRKAVPPRQRVEVVTTDEFVLVESVVVRLARDGERLAAMWDDGAFRRCLRQRPFGALNSTAMYELVSPEPKEQAA